MADTIPAPDHPTEALVLESLVRTLDHNREHNSHVPPVGRVIGALVRVCLASSPDVEGRALTIETTVASMLAGGVTAGELVLAVERERERRGLSAAGVELVGRGRKLDA